MKTGSLGQRRSLYLLIALGLGIAATLTTVPAAIGPSLNSVSSKTLAASGISLESPEVPMSSTPVGKAQAERVAVGRSSETVVREAVLARVHTHLLNGRLCWVVSVLPPGGVWSNGPLGTRPLRGTWQIHFIDANTGENLGGYAGGDVP